MCAKFWNRSAASLDAADALVARAGSCLEAGDGAAAAPLAEQALSIVHALLEPDDVRRVPAMRALGFALLLSDRDMEGLPYLAESSRILEASGAPPDARLVADLLSIGGTLRNHQQVAEAWPYLERFIAQSRALDGGQHESFANVVSLLCAHYVGAGQYGVALRFIDDNLAAFGAQVGESGQPFCDILETRAFALEASGQYAAGLDTARRLATLSAEIFGVTSRIHINALSRIASLQRALGDFDAARDVVHQCVALCDHADDVEADRLPGLLWQLGEIDSAVGDVQHAESNLRQAVALFRALPEAHQDLPNALAALGTLHMQTGHLLDAKQAFEEAFVLHAQNDQLLECGQVLSHLATVQLSVSDFVEADRLMLQSLEYISAAVGDAHPAYARSLHDLGVIQHAAGKRDDARATYERAIAILRAALGDDHLLVANHLQGLGEMNREDRHFADAEAQLTRALAIMRRVLQDGTLKVRTVLRGLASVYAATQRIDRAVALLLEELAGEFEMTCQLFALSSTEQRTRLLAAGSALDPLLTLVTQHCLGNDAIVTATCDQVLRRKGMAVEALSAERSAVYGGKHPELRAALDALRELRERIARSALAGPGAEGPDEHLRLLDEWEDARREQEIALARDVPELALSARLRTADVRSVSDALPPGSALIDFIEFTPRDLPTGTAAPARLLAFVLAAGSAKRVTLIDLGDAAPITAMIADVRSAITGREETRKFVDDDAPGASGQPAIHAPGDRLRIALLDPVFAAATDARRLYLSPDGALHRLPFEIIPTSRGRLVIDDFVVSYIGAGRDVLRFNAEHSGAATQSVVVADPDFDLRLEQGGGIVDVSTPADRDGEVQRAGLRFGRLAGTRTEGEQVASLLGARAVFGRDAIERLVKGVQSPRILHLATHGFFLPDREESTAGAPPASRLKGRLANPMLRSGLALAGANTWLSNGSLPDGAEDALLNGEDVSGMDLLATELVVLSACESGLGAIQAGEGVFGLRRAFVLAGASTLIVSLWPVPDAQTQVLMCDLYRRLQAGVPRVDALRESQLALKATFPDPRFWGAFICVGDPAALAYPMRHDELASA